jgi:hypothetical protein
MVKNKTFRLKTYIQKGDRMSWKTSHDMRRGRGTSRYTYMSCEEVTKWLEF